MSSGKQTRSVGGMEPSGGQSHQSRIKAELAKLQTVASKDLYESAQFLEKCSDQEEALHLLKTLNNELRSKGNPFRLRAFTKAQVLSVVAANTFGASETILKKTKVKVTENPTKSEMVVLFCPVCTRAASDVCAAMEMIPDGARMKPVVLVMMHHTRETDVSMDITDWSDKYDNIVLHVNIIYHRTKNGLIKCSSNTKAIKKIRKFCKSYKQRPQFLEET